MMILSQYHIFELDTINIYSVSNDTTVNPPLFSLANIFTQGLGNRQNLIVLVYSLRSLHQTEEVCEGKQGPLVLYTYSGGSFRRTLWSANP